MPLLPGAIETIRENLEEIVRGGKPKTMTIGDLWPEQLATINKYRNKKELPPISGEVFFIGRHIHQSRIVRDGYSVDDVMDQIISAFCEEAEVINGPSSTAIRNPDKRQDRYGNTVRDEAVFECFRHNPKSQLFSVIARGDFNKPAQMKEAAVVAAPLEDPSGSPG